jgi:hypothetical protein
MFEISFINYNLLREFLINTSLKNLVFQKAVKKLILILKEHS